VWDRTHGMAVVKGCWDGAETPQRWDRSGVRHRKDNTP
jgi:hypothetical protein